jgi:protein TonB
MKSFKYLLLFCLLSLPFLSRAQETEYLDGDYKKVADKSLAKYYRVTTLTDSVAGNIKTYLMNGQITNEDNYAHVKKRKSEGVSKTWFEENGQLRFDLNYKEGKYDGPLRSYYKDGKLKRDDVYQEGKLVKGRCLTHSGQDTAFYEFEIKPLFPGGETKMMQYLSTNIRYPRKALRAGISGLVVASFDVNDNGTISRIEILQQVNDAMDQEVIRIISAMPRWQPGEEDGKKVRIRFTLPVRFSLN